MFIHSVPDNKGGKDGYYCSLVESKLNQNGVCVHVEKINFGFIPSSRLPYLKAAFNKGDPEEILKKEKTKMDQRRKKTV